jgi:hypothetical protein
MNLNIQSLSINEAIRRIEQLGGEYDPDSNLDIWDQLLACETLAESTPVNPNDLDGITIQHLKGASERSESVNRSVNDIGKQQANLEETQRKKQAIIELTTFNYRTSPKKIVPLLQTVFSSSSSQDGHWLYIAQHYTPKSINSVIRQMTKTHIEGWVTIKNPAAYFTDVLKRFHSMRKRPK